MSVIDTPNNLLLTAPAPNATKSCGTEAVGQPGIRTYYYWVIANYPIGSSVSIPFLIRNAPDPLNASNYVVISWESVPNVTSYDLLRTDTSEFPAVAGNYAVITGITTTFWRDQGAPLAHYDPTGLKYGAPVRCRISLNNRDYPRPTVEIPCYLKVSTVVFPDGSVQSSAGAGAGQSPWMMNIDGNGFNLSDVHDIDITGTFMVNGVPIGGGGQNQTPWLSDINGAQHNLINVKTINATESYLLNGIPLAVAGSVNLTNIKNISGEAGQPVSILSNTAITGTLTVNGNPVLVDPTTTLGDLLVRSSTAVTRLALGTDGQVLTVDNTQPNHLRWDAPPSAPVASVFGRTGAVVAAVGDYTAAQVTNAVSTLGSYADPTWITSLDWDKLDNVPAGLGEPAGATGQLQYNGGGTPPAFAASANLHWDSANNRLGIGTAAPAYPLQVAGDMNITGTGPTAVYRVNGAPLAFDATQINLNPGVSTWTTTQNAIAGMNTLLQTLSRGMAYVGTYDAGADVATFVASVGIAPGPLPAPNAAGLHPGDFIICTTATTTGPHAPLNVGDQLLTDGVAWNRIAVGHSLASVTAATVPLSPVVGGWNTVQDAMTALNTLNTNAVLTTGSYANPAWITSLDWSKIANAPAGASVWQTASGNRIYYTAGHVGIGTNDPQYDLDIDGDLNITGDFSINDVVFAAAGSVNLQATSITGLDGEPLLVTGDVKFAINDTSVTLQQLLNRLDMLEQKLAF